MKSIHNHSKLKKSLSLFKMFNGLFLMLLSPHSLAISIGDENKETNNSDISTFDNMETDMRQGVDIIFGSGFEPEPVLNFSANPEYISFNGSIALTWNIGNTPTQCTKSGDWPENGLLDPSDITNGFHALMIDNIDSNKNYTLSCTNEYGTTEKSAFVRIATSFAWPSCQGSAAAILNGNEDRSILAQGPGFPATNYNGFYTDIYNNSGSDMQNPWPGTLGVNLSLNLEKNHYIAAQFTTSNEEIDAKFLSQVPSNNEGVPPQSFTISISECPGDFNVHLNQAACKQSFETFRWTTTPNPPGPEGFFCELEKYKTYYLNIVHSNNESDDNYDTTSCLSQPGTCGHLSSQSLVIIR